MKFLKYLFLLVIIGCSSSKVVSDYDSQTDFTQYKTFNFFEDVGEGLNELDKKRITNALTAELEAKGMQFADTPDFYINVISKEQESLNRNTIGIGIGSGGRNGGFGISGGIPIGNRKIDQKLMVDFVESKNNELIWQGMLHTEFREKASPEEKNTHYKKVIAKIISKYPPKKASN